MRDASVEAGVVLPGPDKLSCVDSGADVKGVFGSRDE
jgi:hypothetical protein